MRLRELTVSQFRAWSYYSLSFHPSLQYIQGPNGSGKTSLLEAIGFLSNGRSVRTHRDRECVQHDCHSFSVRGEFEDADVDTVSLQYRTDSSSDSRKVVKVDEETLPRLSQLQRLITTIYFSSEDLLTLKKGPSRRRQFMNEVLSRLDDQYLNQLRQYQQALDQRNSLLKKPDPDEVLLESIEETMAKNATTVIRRRSELFPALQPDLVEEHGQLTHSGDVSLSIDYDPDVGEPDSLLDRLRDERSRAEQRGYTTIGPQRDDWMIRENGQSVGKFNSQGELRTLVFALKFATAEHIMRETGQWPIMLFDDMVSDLDDDRITRCLDRARTKPFQLIFTGTRPLVDQSFISNDCQVSLT